MKIKVLLLLKTLYSHFPIGSSEVCPLQICMHGGSQLPLFRVGANGLGDAPPPHPTPPLPPLDCCRLRNWVPRGSAHRWHAATHVAQHMLCNTCCATHVVVARHYLVILAEHPRRPVLWPQHTISRRR